MRFWAIFSPVKVGQTKVENMHFCRLSWNWVFKVDLGTHFRHLLLWELKLFWPFFKVGKTKVENMHFCEISRNWNFKVDLDTHLRDKHGHLFLWYLELFWILFKVGQAKVENMHFCRLSWNWVLKVDLDTHLGDKQGLPILIRFGVILALVQGWLNQSWIYALLSTLSEL